MRTEWTVSVFTGQPLSLALLSCLTDGGVDTNMA